MWTSTILWWPLDIRFLKREWMFVQVDGAVYCHAGEHSWRCDAFPLPICWDLHPLCLQLLDHIWRLDHLCIWFTVFVRTIVLSQTSDNDVSTGSSSVPSMQCVSGLLYSLYRITLVDEYEYDAMVKVDDVMAPLLCGTFLAASSILCVNLLIALLTDTFQRSEVTPGQNRLTDKLGSEQRPCVTTEPIPPSLGDFNSEHL